VTLLPKGGSPPALVDLLGDVGGGVVTGGAVVGGLVVPPCCASAWCEIWLPVINDDVTSIAEIAIPASIALKVCFLFIIEKG
jgi:hypothetical protein